HLPVGYYLILWGTWMVTYTTYLTVESVRAARTVQRLRTDTAGAEPNDTPLRGGVTALTGRYRGRGFRSQTTLLGLPLLGVNGSDPGPPEAAVAERRVARGWIAIGEDARGVLLAVGSTACGFLAIGGRTAGVLSFGGVAVGVVAVGGVALGGVALGGVGLGGI